jgi:phosphoribosylformylglycinamidine synthase subunit PurQ / glutaminase
MRAEEVKVCVIRIEGTNCEDECARAFNSIGADAEKVHLKQLLRQCPPAMRRDLGDYHILAFPGGFSAGDYVRAGAIFAARMKSGLSKDLIRFIEAGKPVIGICNGFQILVELGALPALDGEALSREPEAALYTNSSGRFECLPTLLKHENRGNCVFTSDLPRHEVVMFPSAHAEGKLMFPKESEGSVLDRMEQQDQVVFKYVDEKGDYAGYPWCPNGSVRNIAGISNVHGNVFGLMPHPERVFDRFTHPDWTRTGDNPVASGDGRAVFESALKNVLRKN